MERMVAVCGKKWSKRAIGFSAPLEQLQFVWRAARYLTPSSAAAAPDATAAAGGGGGGCGGGCGGDASQLQQEQQLEQQRRAEEWERLLQLRASVLEALPADMRGHFSISEQQLREMEQDVAAWGCAGSGDGGGGGGDGAVSAISLASVGDALEEEALWEDWLHTVMKLLLGPIHVQLPLDANGQPDFMDSWSAVPLRAGVDVMSAADFMQLIAAGAAAKGLVHKQPYNAFLVLADPTDRLASLVFRLASGTQVLDYITSVVLGSAKGFMPNLHTGLTAACLTQLLSQRPALTTFQWAQVQQMAHTLRMRHTNAAKGVTAQLLRGQANPEDNISKLLLALLRLYSNTVSGGHGAAAAAATAAPAGGTIVATAAAGPDSCSKEAQEQQKQQQERALGLVLQEWLASLMQRHYGKQTPESNALYLESVLKYMPAEALLLSSSISTTDAAFDPLQQLHPLETLNRTNLGAADTHSTTSSSSSSSAPASLSECIRHDWQAVVMQRLLGATPGLSAHPALAQFVLCAGRLLALLLPPTETSSAAATAGGAAGAQAAVSCSLSTVYATASEPLAATHIHVLELLPGPVAMLDSCWPGWREAALQAVLLRFRTPRYTCTTQEQPDAAGAAGDATPAAAPEVAPAPSTTVAAAAAGRAEWEPAAVGSSMALAVRRLQEGMSGQLRGYRNARFDAAKQRLLAAAVGLLQQHADNADAACTALKHLKLGVGTDSGNSKNDSAADVAGDTAVTDAVARVTAGGGGGAAAAKAAVPGGVSANSGGPVAGVLGGLTCTLQRTDVPAVLEQLMAPCDVAGDAASTAAAGVTPSMLHALVLGDWSSQGPQVFRRSVVVQQLCMQFSCEHILAAIRAQEVCCRAEGHNRHGHSCSMQFPGPAGWTPEYATARLASVAVKCTRKVRKVQATVNAMEQYTAMAAWARGVAAGAKQQAAVETMLAGCADAKRHARVLTQLQDVLGQTMMAV